MGFQRIKFNKKGLQFRNAFFAIIVLGVIVVSTGIIISNWNSYYSSGITWNLGGLDQSTAVYNTANTYASSSNPKSPEAGSDYQSNIYQSAYGIITNLVSPFAMVFGENGMLYSIASTFGIPSYIIIAIVTMMVIALVFAFISIIFKQFKNTV